MTPEVNIPGDRVLMHLRNGLLGGVPMAGLYTELTKGGALSGWEQEGRLMVEGPLTIPQFGIRGRRVVATVAGDALAVGVVRAESFQPGHIATGGLLHQSESIFTVASNYYDENGSPLGRKAVEAGDLDAVTFLFAFTNYRGGSRLSSEYDLYVNVSSKAKQLVHQEFDPKWSFNID